MQLIPVLDVMGGRAVRAVRGDRQAYQPVQSRLCVGSDPVAVARAMVRHCASELLYVADLDVLTGRAAQTRLLRQLLAKLPGLSLWLDAGFADCAAADRLQAELGPEAHRVTPVFGSESLRDAAALRALTAMQGPDGQGAILSLDSRQGRPLDAAGCWTTPAAWPSRVVAMTLDRVGADAGPDLSTLARLRAQAPQAAVIGAGGIRHAADLDAAAAAGAVAWLVASALHSGALSPVATPDGCQ